MLISDEISINKELRKVWAELERSKMMLRAIEEIVAGREASDFEMSFPLIKKIADVGWEKYQ